MVVQEKGRDRHVRFSDRKCESLSLGFKRSTLSNQFFQTHIRPLFSPINFRKAPLMDSNELEKINNLLDRDLELREVILPPIRRKRRVPIHVIENKGASE